MTSKVKLPGVVVIDQSNQSTHPTHDSSSNTRQENVMGQPKYLKRITADYCPG